MHLPLHRFQVGGDIIFVRTYQKVPINRFAQLLATAREARYTHVLLCVMPGLYVEALAHSGVQLVCAESDEVNFPAHYGEHWEVRRNAKVSGDIQKSALVSNRARYYLGQRYNGVFGLGKYLPPHWSDSHSFCSELVARVYQDLGEPITERGTAWMLPLHLELATRDHPDWTDVTEAYRAWFQRTDDTMSPIDSSAARFSDATRLLYVKSVQVIWDSSVVLKTSIPKINEINSVLQTAFAQFAELSEAAKSSLFGVFNMNPRSYRDFYSALLDGIFLHDERLSAESQAAPDQKPSNWVLKTAEPLTATTPPEHFYNSLKRALEGSQRLTSSAAQSLLRSLEPYLLFAVSRQGSLPEGLEEHGKNVVENAVKLLDGMENYDDYDSDLAALDNDFRKRLEGKYLSSDEARALVGGMLRELRCRQAWRARIRPALDHLRQNPGDGAAAYDLYNDLLQLAPTEPA